MFEVNYGLCFLGRRFQSCFLPQVIKMSEFESSLWSFISEQVDWVRQKIRDRQHEAYLERQRREHEAYLERQRREQEAYLERQRQQHLAYLERQREIEQQRHAQREENRRAYYERLTNNVLRFRAQYENTLNDVKNQGLYPYIQSEYDEIARKVQQLDVLLNNESIEAARDLSLEIGQSIHGLIPLARKAKRQAEQKERQERLEEARRLEEEIRRKARQDFIDQMKRNLEQDKDSNPKAVEESVKNLERLKNNIGSMSESELQDKLTEESDKVDGEIADETVRRQVIKSIYLSLKKAGFIVSNPQLTGDVVLIRAQKPAGQQAEFTVKLDGGLTFKFDNYEGQKCRKDIDEVTRLLDECYGVKLSDAKVLWSNPDRIQKGSKENPSGGGAKSSSNG